ncbi:hypothetical protein BDZ90DRAFT_281969 [Jaminaea rosea]|uniref:Complex 1 LYR protein domain-containing protein n=1 Tax=Jaminaea rosea TaxID=1569628 RepID=A0A316UJE6_9BASI|nr:hypothetical protein BDZ90DRAFT_281969 [Jaminaea rosea]PWN24988.1 hypothetical protein BDZ90DRAFT_281969 [Jaminaea rosea]
MSSPSRAQILGLYRKYLATAQSFSSYNFRTYFLRRSRDLFRSTLLPPASAATSSPFSPAGAKTSPVSPSTLTSPAPSILESTPLNAGDGLSNPSQHAGGSLDAEKLKAFYETAKKDLEVLRRAALMNRMYEGERLVVEHPQLIIGGGGAGAEASTGGGGHPTAGPQSSGGAPSAMGFRHNNVLHNNHFRKDWQRRVKVWFDQPGAKKSRRNARQAKAAALGLRPLKPLRPAVRCPTLKYNTKLREGKGFTAEEIKAAGLRKKEAKSVGIPVDHRRRNKSEESLKLNADRIKAYHSRLVVLPRRNKKNKDKKVDLSSITSVRDTAAAFPIPAGIPVEAPRAITSEEKEVNAFRTLREERAKHRNEGARLAREKKKEEEAAAAKK